LLRAKGTAPITDRAVNRGRKGKAFGKRALSAIPPQSTQHWWSIYIGRQSIGHVISRGRAGYESFDQHDRSVGIFSDLRTAAAALPDDGGAP
jgi:hypothetical protein